MKQTKEINPSLDNYKFGTKAIHAGADADPSTGAIMTPIFQTSTYVQESPGVNKGYGYARGKNPTREALQKNIANEYFLYEKACDVLIEIQKIPLKNINIAHYNHATLFREVMLFIDWYLPLKNHTISLQQIQDYKFYWIELFDKLSKSNQAIVLRDYHADNLMVLNNQNGFEAVGLLDFQDALVGSCAYDLLSLLEDARRDVDEKNKQKLFDYFISKANYNRQDFLIDYEIISLQRNIKILGIFARLNLRDGKNQYINFMPRVKNFVEQRLDKTNLISPQFKNFLKVYLQ
jgi:aminoglycoside/choline kinase family phosphotransferase